MYKIKLFLIAAVVVLYVQETQSIEVIDKLILSKLATKKNFINQIVGAKQQLIQSKISLKQKLLQEAIKQKQKHVATFLKSAQGIAKPSPTYTQKFSKQSLISAKISKISKFLGAGTSDAVPLPHPTTHYPKFTKTVSVGISYK